MKREYKSNLINFIFSIFISLSLAIFFILQAQNLTISLVFLYIFTSLIFLKMVFDFKSLKESLLSFIIVTSFFGSYLRVYNKTYLPVYRVCLIVLILIEIAELIRNIILKIKKSDFNLLVNTLMKLLKTKVSYLFLLICVFTIYGLLSYFRLDKISYWNYQYLAFLLQGFLISLFIVFIFNTRAIYKVINNYLYISIFTILFVSLIEVFFKRHLPEIKEGISAHIPVAFYYNPNNFGLILSVLLPFVYLKDKEFSIKKVHDFLITILFVFIIVIIGSRLSIIAVSIFLFLSLFLQQYRVKLLNLIVVFSFLTFFVSLLYRKLYLLVSQITGAVVSLFNSGIYEVSENVRLQLYRLGLKEMLKNPLGHGPGGAEYFYSNFKDSLGNMINPHSLWVEIGVNFGLIGFLSFTCFYGGLLYLLIKKRLWCETNNKNYIKYLLNYLIFSLLVYPIVSFSPSSNIYPHILPWIIYGFALNLLTKSENNYYAKAA